MRTAALEICDLSRVCRDLAWSEVALMPAMAQKLGTRCSVGPHLDWSVNGLALDSLACMQLATAAATWCNAFEKGYEDLFLAKRNTADWALGMRRVTDLGGTHLTFSSSGSTGARKHIRHALKILTAEAQVWADLLNASLTGGSYGSNISTASGSGFAVKRVVCLAPTHHIYGFIWGVLLPRVLKVPVLDAELHALPELLSGDVVVALPDQWAWLAQAGHSTQCWPEGVKGVSSTAPLPAHVHRALTAQVALPAKPGKPALLQLLQIYGSAETAGLAWRDSPDEPYTLAMGRARTPTDGIALQRVNAEPVELSVQDVLVWVDAQRFHVAGRLDHCVQVGGHNVSPKWVSAQLASLAYVEDVVVRLGDGLKPPRLKAFVVVKQPEQTNTRTLIETWAAEHLPWFANPGTFTYGVELPRSSTGKLCDWPDSTVTAQQHPMDSCIPTPVWNNPTHGSTHDV